MPKPTKTSRGKRPLLNKAKLKKEKVNLDNSINKNARPLGQNGDFLLEPIPKFNRASCEKVQSHGNSWIVLGRDRYAGLNSGFMGATATGASSIDMVVGRGASHKPFGSKIASPPDEDVTVNPNFFTDAARIYISQTTLIDEYFGLATNKYDPLDIKIKDLDKARSGIGIKADTVRIVGRNNIKIVTGKGFGNNAPRGGEPNSLGGEIDGPGTISLIAGNYTDGHFITEMPFARKLAKVAPNVADLLFEKVETLQPIPKGDNLVKCIEDLIEIVNSLSGLVLSNHQGIMDLAAANALHFHDYGGGFGPTTPSSTLAFKMIPTYIRAFVDLLENYSATYNYGTFLSNYTKRNSPYYINSRHVFTT